MASSSGAIAKQTLNSYPLTINKVTLRYQDGGKIRDEFNEDVDDNQIHFIDEHYNNEMYNKYARKGNQKTDEDLTIEKSFNRLSLLKYRETQPFNTPSSNIDILSTSRNSDRYVSGKISNKKLNTQNIVSDIVPLMPTTPTGFSSITNINNNDSHELNVRFENNNAYNLSTPNDMMYENTSLYAPSMRIVQTNTNVLPKVIKSNQQRSNVTRQQIPNATKISHNLPRPYTNQINRNSKMFNLVFGINSKFIEKYIPRDKQKQHGRHGLVYLNEKLPGHLALYKLMKENTRTSLTSAGSSTDILRKQISTRGINLNNDSFNSILTTADTATRFNIQSPVSLPPFKDRSTTYLEINTKKTHQKLLGLNKSPTPQVQSAVKSKDANSLIAYMQYLQK